MLLRVTSCVRSLPISNLRLRLLPPHAALGLLAALVWPGSLPAQNYGSHMNSAERARESQRYESALLQGTYNNPMLQGSNVDPRTLMRGLDQAKRDEEAAKFAQQEAERRRRWEEQAEKERRAAAEAYYRAREAEARVKRQEFERNFAAVGLRRWGYQDLTQKAPILENLARVRASQLDAIPVHELYATALTLRRNPEPTPAGTTPRSPEHTVARLALEALARGQMLPAVLLADDLMQDRDFLRRIACEGTEFDHMLPVYYTGGHGWITENELALARTYGLVTAQQLADFEATREQLKVIRGGSQLSDPRDQVLRLLRESQLLPWQGGRARLSFQAQADLAALRESRPALGHFVAALYEERLRYDSARPSPWSGFLFERAAQLASPGFITEVARIRRETTGAGEAAAFRRWRERPASGQAPEIAGPEAHALWRVAGRLILGHDLAGLSPALADLTAPAAIAQRLTLAHDILWELTTRGDRHALTVQYLAAIQDPAAARPSLLAYLNAYHWALDWDLPPMDFQEKEMFAAAFLETLPASRLGRHYADTVTKKALQSSVPDLVTAQPYAMLGQHSWYTSGYLEGLPLPAAIVPAVIVHRQRVGTEKAWLQQLGETIRTTGFGAQLARQLQLEVARIQKDARLEATAREHVARLARAGAAPVATPPPTALDRALLQLGEAALTLSGSSLLCEPLPLAAAPDSLHLLEAVALRNLAVKPFLPYIRLLPLPHAALTERLGRDSALRRTVAAQALDRLDDSYATAVNLPASLVTQWLKAGAAQGDARCRLRLSQIALHGGPLAGAADLTAAAAEKILAEAVEAGVPGAVEFQFERLRRQGKAVTPEQLFAFVHAARAKGSPLAAQAWLDALDETRSWTPELAVQETIALRVARDDMREGAADRWWKALGRWSAHLRTHRDLFLGRPEVEQFAHEVARLVRQIDSLSEVYPRDRLKMTSREIFPHLATASGNLPPGPATSAFRETMATSRLVQDELRYGSFVPLENSLYFARTEKDQLPREYAAMDAARWYVVNPSSRVQHFGQVLISLLPAEPDRHPLWEPAPGLRFVAAAFRLLHDRQAMPESFAANVGKLTGVIARLPATTPAADLATLANSYEDFTLSARYREGIRELPEVAALVDAFDRIARSHAGLAPKIYAAGARIAPRAYVLAAFDRLLQPAGTWISPAESMLEPLTAADHVNHLRRVASFDAHRLGDGIPAINAWIVDAKVKVEKAGETARLEELAAVSRQLVARWSAFPVETPDRWGVAAFNLTAYTEMHSPSPDKSAELLRALQPRAKSLGNDPAVRRSVLQWKDQALTAKSRESLTTLEIFAPEEAAEALDELEGAPRRKAAQAEYERRLAMIEPCLELLKAGRHVPLVVRTVDRLGNDGLMIHAWTQLTAVKAATLGAGGAVTLPTEPRVFAAVVNLLFQGAGSWEEEEIKELALELSPVAQRLWETRDTWSPGRERHLMWMVRHYAQMKQPWAVAAWPALKENPSPGLRLALTHSGLGRELGVPPVTEAEAKSPAYVAAESADRAPPPSDDDPVAEFTALQAAAR